MPLIVDEREYYTRQEVCTVLGIKSATLYAYVSRGLLSSYRQGIKRRRLYLKSEVDGMLNLSSGARAGAPVPPAPRRPAPDIPLAESWIGYT